MTQVPPKKETDLLPEVESREGQLVIQPKNEYYMVWQHFVAFVYLVSVCIGFFLPTFDSTSGTLWMMCYFADVVNFVDMVVMFFVAYVDPKSGAIRDDRHSIMQYRLKTSFIYDLCGLLPLELLAIKFPGHGIWRQAALYHLNRSVRIYKTIMIFQEQEQDLTHSRMIAASFKYLMVLVIVVQCATCAWFKEACLGHHDFAPEFLNTKDYQHHNFTPMHCYSNSWLVGALESINANMSRVMDVYIMSLYWTTATVTAVGYGDIVAYTSVEKLVSFITMILGITVFNGLMFGGLTSMLTNDDAKRNDYTDKLKVVKATLKELDVAEDLAKSVVSFYEYTWKERHGFLTEKNELFDSLPHSFQAEICYAINACALAKAPLFENTNEGFMRVVSTKIKQSLYLPHQIIVKQGDIGSELFYIRVGAVEILGEDESSVVAVLNAGMVFGEINLIFSMPRTATARAATFCELLILTREDFQAVITHYPAVNESITALAKARYREINEQKMKKAEKKSDPHYKARQARKTSYVPPSRIRRYSFATNERDDEETNDPKGVQMEQFELRRLEEKDEHRIKEYIGLKKIHESSASKQTMIAMANAVKSVLAFMATYFMPFWKGFMIIVAVFTALLFPYVACFYYSDYQLPGYDPHTSTGQFWLVVTYALDFCLLTNMYLLCRADFDAYCVKNRSLTKTTFKLLREYILGREYLNSWNFRLNLLSIVPIELFSVIQSHDPFEEWRQFGFLRLNRVTQFFLLMRHLKKLEDDIHVALGKLRSLQVLIYIIVFTHWCACALFLIHCQGVDCSDPTWYSVYIGNLPNNVTMQNMTQDEKLIVSLYYSVATLTSAGFGEINAVSVPGMVVSIVTMVVGILLFGYAVAIMAATLANSDSARVRFQSRLLAVKTFMKEQHLSSSLQHRIFRYLQLMWIKYKGVWMPGDAGLLEDCPAGVRYDIALEDAHKTLAKVPLFMHMDDDFLRDIAIRCHSFYFFPGEDIMHAGDISNELYVIKRGYCAAWSMDMKRKLADLGPGGFFGDQALLFGDQNQFTVQADTYCDVLVLATEDFQAVLAEYPEVKEQFDMASNAKEYYIRVQTDNFEKNRIQLFDENHAANVGEEEEYTEHVETETQQDSVVSFAFGNKKHLYESFISRKGFRGKLAKTFLFSYSFSPEGKLLHYKVHTVSVLSFIVFLTIPIQIAFLYDQTPIWLLHCVFDLLFLGNLYFNMHVGFYNPQAVLVTHPFCTSRNYMRKNFIWDLLFNFPWELIVLARYGEINRDILHVMSMVRMNRLCNGIKVKLSFNYFESRMDKQFNFLRETEFTIFMIMFLNLSACVVFLAACPPMNLVSDTSVIVDGVQGYHCFNDSWVVKGNLLNEDTLTLYMYSIYWATATVVSVGYGDMHASNWLEMRMMIILMTVGVLFFAYIVASIASAMANADSGRARFQDKLNGIRTLMKDHQVNRRLRNRVVNYYTYLWRRTHGVNPSTLFDGVPHCLLSDITYALYSDTINKISLFTHADHGFVKMLSRCMKPMYFLNTEFIVRKNDIGEEMFFIDRGEVEVCNAEGTKVFATIGAGGAFGEVALLFSCRRTASVRAKTNVDVFCLAKKDLDRVLNLYPEIKKHVMEIGKERRKQAAARPLRKREDIAEEQPKTEVKTQVVKEKKNMFEELTQTARLAAAKKQEEAEKEAEAALKKKETKTKKKTKTVVPQATDETVAEKEKESKEKASKEKASKEKAPKEKASKEKATTKAKVKESGSDDRVEEVKTKDTDRKEEKNKASKRESIQSKETYSESVATDIGDEEEISLASSPRSGTEEADDERTWYAHSPDFMYGSDMEDGKEEDDADSRADTSNNNADRTGNNNTDRTGNNNSDRTSNNNADRTSNNNRNQSNKNKPKEAIDLEDQGFVEFLLDPTQTIEPDSERYQKFRLFLELIGSILAWITMYQMCFFDFHVAIIATVYCCDVVNIIGLYIRVRVTYYDDHGILVKDHKLARLAYLKNPAGFFMDLASVLPIELACFGFDVSERGYIWSSMRVLRLLRVFHVLSFFRDWERELNVNVLKVRLIKFTFITLFLTHLTCCLWFMLACPMGRCDYHKQSWIIEWSDQIGNTKLSWYITSLYWTMATMTTTGYGDYYATNIPEMAFAIFAMLAGKLMFGFILGNIASTLANSDARMTNYRNTLSGILGRLQDQEVPLHMRQHVVAYLDYTWIRNQGHDFTQLFNDAPTCLAAEILHAVAKPFFDAMILFKDLEDAFVRRMALSVHRVLYQEGDYIAHKDDLGDEVLFVFRGSILVIEHDENDAEHKLGYIGYGTVIGECFLVQSMPRLMSLKANERTDLLTIDRSAVLDLLAHYPSSRAIFDSHAQEHFVEAGFMTEIRV